MFLTGRVVGSSPTGGAKKAGRTFVLPAFIFRQNVL